MMSPSRRVLLGWIGTLAPALGAVAAWPELDERTPTPFEFLAASQKAAALKLGQWLTRKGITTDALDGVEGSVAPTHDIRESFAKDPLITVDGFLLPAGFCRYCLDAYGKES
jgi:hypothetical protein